MSLHWGRDGMEWQPHGGEYRNWHDLKPGDLIAMGRKVWRLTGVRPVPPADWEDRDHEFFAACTRPWDGVSIRRKAGIPASEQEWESGPLDLSMVPDGEDGEDEYGTVVRPYALALAWVVPPHYPVCRSCGEPYPCRELDIMDELERQAAEVTRLEGIMPGCCWSCAEPVTSRQKSVLFGGDNLLLPGAPPALFHLRGGCLPDAVRYERRWVPAGQGRTWRFQCPGTLTEHVDGDECTEGPLCPGRVRHPDVITHVCIVYGGRPHPGAGQREYSGLPDHYCLRCEDAAARGESIPHLPYT